MIRAIGANPDASHYAGINVRQTMVIAICLSGALAGMAMTNIILGSPNASDHVLRDNGLNGLGFIGIAVALMGRNHPIGIVLAALLFGSLYAWGERFSCKVVCSTNSILTENLSQPFKGWWSCSPGRLPIWLYAWCSLSPI